LNIKKPKCLKKIQIAENKFIKINMDILEFAKGVKGTHIKVSPKNDGGVVLFVKNQDNNVYLHHAYHYASDDIFLEFIRGFQDSDEDIMISAKRELNEEISYNYEISSEPIFLGKIYPDTTILNSYASLYTIEIESKDKLQQHQDSLEALGDGAFYPIDELNNLIARGEITDGYTLSAYAILKAKNII
jgi:ADP-ribose pyrophosphatase